MDQRQKQAGVGEANREPGVPETAAHQGRVEVRSLDEWELLLVGGGEDSPQWP